MIYPVALENFVVESNRIEGILRAPTVEEIRATQAFLILPDPGLNDMRALAQSYAGPIARLRERVGMNVRVGQHLPPPGGPDIKSGLRRLLAQKLQQSAWALHCDYEDLHPFMDGNGRTGRALWAWRMQVSGNEQWQGIGFLHAFYYQTLQNRRP